MPASERLGSIGRVYVWTVVTSGVLAVAQSTVYLWSNPVPWQWGMLAVLTLLSGSFTVRIPGVSARLSVSDTFVFAAALLFGPEAATMIVVLDTLVISFWLGRASVPPRRLFFNITAPAFAIWAAAHIVYAVGGIEPLSTAEAPPQAVLSIALPLLGLATLYFLLNSWLIAFAVSIQRNMRAFTIWRQNFLWLSLNYFSGASVAALLLPYLLQANTYESFLYVSGVLLPVLIIFYLTFKAALGRVDDANRHLTELNRLYLSTIETLAMAIDAKDQITHGHIRRVQQYAVGLARHLGVTDPAQISAIEAASLLHDMGKLAVPEYILNKPGRLTPTEFERMKLHASVGADILSAIDFPYPVVPIVRHHHENWDGTGYPDGLKGIDIPIGARILAVVDCFDALTSDRPYRPRLADAEAIQILLDRRGTMYDPLVVDAFTSVHGQLAQELAANDRPVGDGLSAIARVSTDTKRMPSADRFDKISASTDEMLVLYELAKHLTSETSLNAAGDIIARFVRRLIPATTYAYYIYDSQSDTLTIQHVTGENASALHKLVIPRGERLTGWVAANRQTIANSDPVLDLGDLARSLKPRLHSCLSTPLVANEQLLGVLTIYSPTFQAFSDDHRRVIETVARQVSPILHRISTREGFTTRKSTHTRPSSLVSFATTPGEVQPFGNASIVLIGLRSALAHSGTTARTVALDLLMTGVQKGLRESDLLFRWDSDCFVALLSDTDSATADAIAQRIILYISQAFADFDATSTPTIYVGVATAPADGSTIDTLIACANERQRIVLEPPSLPSIH